MKAEQFEIDLGKRLQKLRNDKGKNQDQVAKDLGLNSRETVKQWESWDRHIKASDLRKLAKYFDVSSDFLLGLSDATPLDPEINTICRYTGLSEEAIQNIKKCDSALLTRILESSLFFDLLDDLDHLAFLVDLLKEDTEETSKSVPAGNVEENINSLLRENGFPDGVVTGNRPFRYPFEWRAQVSNLRDGMNSTRVQRFELIEAFPALIEELIPCHAVLADAKKTLKERGEVFSRSAEMEYTEE